MVKCDSQGGPFKIAFMTTEWPLNVKRDVHVNSNENQLAGPYLANSMKM